MMIMSGSKVCPICGSTSLRFRSKLGDVKHMQCVQCDHIIAMGASATDISTSAKQVIIIRSILDRAAAFLKMNQRVLIPELDANMRNALSDTDILFDTAPDPLHAPYTYCILICKLSSQHAPYDYLLKYKTFLGENAVLLVLDYIHGESKRITIPKDTTLVQLFSRNTLDSLLNKTGFRYVYPFIFDPKVFGLSAFFCKNATVPMSMRKISIILPVYNEENTVATVIDTLLAKDFCGLEKEIVIVESNSTDHTREIAQSYAGQSCIKAVYEDKPQGKGHGVRTGFAYASGDILAIQDGDMEYDIDDYDELLPPLLHYQKPFILGSRHTDTYRIRQFNEQKLSAIVMNTAHIVFAKMISRRCHTKLNDPFTMYKVFRADCLLGLQLECDRFDLDWEIVLKLLRKGYVVDEIPVSYSSRSFAEGKKVNFLKEPITWLRAYIKYGFSKSAYSAALVNAAYAALIPADTGIEENV